MSPTEQRARIAEHLTEAITQATAALEEIRESHTTSNVYEVVAHASNAAADAQEAYTLALDLYGAWSGQTAPTPTR